MILNVVLGLFVLTLIIVASINRVESIIDLQE